MMTETNCPICGSRQDGAPCSVCGGVPVPKPLAGGEGLFVLGKEVGGRYTERAVAAFCTVSGLRVVERMEDARCTLLFYGEESAKDDTLPGKLEALGQQGCLLVVLDMVFCQKRNF